MQHGPFGDLTTIRDELWGYILSHLSPQEIANAQLSSRAMGKREIREAVWQIKFPQLARKQHAEIEHFKKMIEKRTTEIDQDFKIINALCDIRKPAVTIDEYQAREVLLNNINDQLIVACFQGSDCLDLTDQNLTRFPKQLLEDPALQDFWKNLKELYCADNNLMTLDLSKLVQLRKLNCANNPIAALDLSHCRHMQDLICDREKIKLNVKGCLSLLSKGFASDVPAVVSDIKEPLKKKRRLAYESNILTNNAKSVIPSVKVMHEQEEKSSVIYSKKDNEEEERTRKRKCP